MPRVILLSWTDTAFVRRRLVPVCSWSDARRWPPLPASHLEGAPITLHATFTPATLRAILHSLQSHCMSASLDGQCMSSVPLSRSNTQITRVCVTCVEGKTQQAERILGVCHASVSGLHRESMGPIRLHPACLPAPGGHRANVHRAKSCKASKTSCRANVDMQPSDTAFVVPGRSTVSNPH